MNKFIFVVIRVLLPDTDAWDQLRSRATNPSKPVEIPFRLSSRPPDMWCALFRRAWQLWYPHVAPPDIMPITQEMIITCFPAEIRERRAMAVAMIEQANKISAPLIRGHAARTEAEQRRNKKIDELRTKHENEKLPHIPVTRDGDRVIDMVLGRRADEIKRLDIETRLTEIDEAFHDIVTDDILDAMSRTETNDDTKSNN